MFQILRNQSAQKKKMSRKNQFQAVFEYFFNRTQKTQNGGFFVKIESDFFFVLG